jgi:hypothetical protein
MAPAPKASSLPYHVVGDLYASRTRNPNERMVCRLNADHLVTPTAYGASLTLEGFIGGEQLRAVENIRGGHGLALHLKLDLFTSRDDRIECFRADEHIAVHAGVWNTEIENVDAATVVEVLVPMPLVQTWADSLIAIREGRELLSEGDETKHIDSALVKAGIVLEPIRKKLRTIAVSNKANPDTKLRTQAEREAVLIEALYSYVVGAAHKDVVTKTFAYSRSNAIMALAAVAGLIRGATEGTGPVR